MRIAVMCCASVFADSSVYDADVKSVVEVQKSSAESGLLREARNDGGLVISVKPQPTTSHCEERRFATKQSMQASKLHQLQLTRPANK